MSFTAPPTGKCRRRISKKAYFRTGSSYNLHTLLTAAVGKRLWSVSRFLMLWLPGAEMGLASPFMGERSGIAGDKCSGIAADLAIATRSMRSVAVYRHYVCCLPATSQLAKLVPGATCTTQAAAPAAAARLPRGTGRSAPRPFGEFPRTPDAFCPHLARSRLLRCQFVTPVRSMLM